MGTWNTRRCRPPPDGRISSSSPLRSESFCTTTPENSSSTSMMVSSIGSMRAPVVSSVLNKTRGRETVSSNPSRRMFSIRMASCNSPRPATVKLSLSSFSLMRMAMLRSASFSRRSRMTRLCTLSPSWPASGPSLMRNVMERVGGSTGCAVSGVSTEGSHNVSATVASFMPAIATMSPASATSTGVRLSPRNASTFCTRNVSIWLPSLCSALSCWLGRTVPEVMRPVRMRPR